MPKRHEITTHGERIAAVIACGLFAAAMLVVSVGHMLQLLRIEEALKCHGKCLATQTAVVIMVDPPNQPANTVIVRFQSGKTATIESRMNKWGSYNNGQKVTVGLYKDAVVTINGHYAYNNWPAWEFILLMFVPGCAIVVLLELPRLFDRRELERRYPSSATTFAFAAAVSMAVGLIFAGLYHVWQIPMLAGGFSLTMIGYVVLYGLYKITGHKPAE